jgi:hypothetical protein
MSKNSSSTNNLKRLAVFVAGVPGYLLTFLPWLFVLTIVFVAVSNYTTSGQVSLSLDTFAPQSILLVQHNEVLVLTLVSFILWVFFAWLSKRCLLFISRKIGETEKVWQITKFSGLVLGWFAVLLSAIFVFHSVSSGFMMSELIVVAIGAISFALEFLLTKVLVTKK